MTRAAVLGGAPNVWDDFGVLRAMVGGRWDGLVIVVNDVGVHYPDRVDAWATLHPEKLAEADPDHPGGWSWERQRREFGHPGGYTTYARRRPDLVHEIVENWGGGSVALYAAGPIAFRLGADRVVLCGCPLDTSGAFAGSTTSHTVSEHLETYRQGWVRRIERGREPGRYLTENVRSLSGWTKELLGGPDPAWLGLSIHDMEAS